MLWILYSMTANVAGIFLACFKKSHVMCHISCVRCHKSHVICQHSHVTCCLSLATTARAMDSPSANSPTMYSRLVGKEERKKLHRGDKASLDRCG